jgi:hypothetical protein
MKTVHRNPCAYGPRFSLNRAKSVVRRAALVDTALKTVTVDLGDRTYPIYIGSGLLQQPELLTDHIRGKAVLVVTNQTIAPLYLSRCANVFFLRDTVCTGVCSISDRSPIVRLTSGLAVDFSEA